MIVPGGRIDHAHHDNWAYKALDDTVALDDAIARALDLTDEEETLIIATADHSHVFTMAGYGANSHDILGKCSNCMTTVYVNDRIQNRTLILRFCGL